ncbi:MAG: hypothetical protein OHK0046_34270 [Anaerolineae bacterium]
MAETGGTVDWASANTVDGLESVLPDAWDIVILFAAEVQETLSSLPDSNTVPSLIVLYESSEEAYAFSLTDRRIIHLIPLNGAHRLPGILSRESNLQRLRQSARQLKQVDNRFKAIVEGFGDSIIIIDHYGVVRYTNDALHRWFGYDVAAVSGKGFQSFVHETERGLVGEFLAELLTSEQHLLTLAHQFQRSSGEWASVETTGHSMLDPDNRLFVALHIRDVSDQQRRKEALLMSEARYRAIVEDQQELICRYTPDFLLTYTNHAYSQQYGKTPEDMIGTSILELIPSEDLPRAGSHVRALSKAQPVAFSEHRSVLPDGSVRWQQWSDHAIFDSDGNIVEYQGVGRDITEAKAAQDRLNFLYTLIFATSTAENLDAALCESMKIICEAQRWEYGEIWMPDAHQQELRVGAAHYIHPADSGRLQAFWEATQPCTFKMGSGIPGYTWERQSPTWYMDVQHQSQPDFVRAEQGKKAGLHGVVAVPIVDGKQVLAVMLFMAQRPLYQDDALLQLLSNAVQQIAPIIRRQQLTDQLVGSEEKYRTLVENFDGVITVSDPDGRYLFANEKAWEPFGLLPHERQGKSVYDLFSREVGDLFVERVREVIKTGQPRTDIDGMQTGADYRWFRSTIAPLKETDGTINRVQTIAFDVTDTYQAEAQLQQAQEIAHLGSWSLNFHTNEMVWSDEFFRICGLEPGSVEETVEQGFLLVHPDDRERSAQAVAYSQATGNPYSIEKRVVRPNGDVRWVISQGQVNFDAASQPWMLVGTFLDITERKEAELALAHTLHRLNALHTIDQSILRADTLEQTAAFAVRGIAQTMPVHRISISLIDEQNKQARILALYTQSLDTHLPVGTVLQMTDSELEALQQPYRVIHDVRQYPGAIARLLYEEGVRSILSVGLKQESRLIGALSLHAATEAYFEGDNLQVPIEIAAQLAIAIHTMQLNEQIRRHNEELEDRVSQRTAELWLQQRRTEAILQSSSDGIVLLDEKLHIRSSNHAFRKMFECDQAGCVGLSLLEIISSDDRNLLQSQLEATINDEINRRCEVRAVRQGNQIIYVEVGIARVQQVNGDMPNLVCALRDVTERKYAEAKLAESEERYRTTIAAMSEGIVMQTQDGEIRLANNAAEHILGLTLEQLMGRTSVDPRWHAIHEDGSPFPGETHPGMVALRTGEPQANVVMGVHKPDGSLVWILINSQPIGEDGEAPYAVVTTFTDITERKHAEEQLQSVSQRLQLATEAGGIGIWEWDIQNHQLIWDQQMYRLYGMEPHTLDEPLSELWLDKLKLLHPDDKARVQRENEAFLASGTRLDSGFRVILPDHTVRHIRTKAMMFRDHQHRPLRSVGINWDITDERTAAEALQRALEQEKELSELKSRFVSMASHEFRTPLATISATTETLLAYRDRLDGEKLNARLRKIMGQVGHMKDIMEDVLQLARIQAGRMEFKPEAADLEHLCRDIIEEFASRPEYTDRIIFQCNRPSLLRNFDLRLMRHVISNLISNALKYSSSEDSVLVDLRVHDTTITLKVQDSGIGIPEPDLKHLFEPFHRARNVGTISGTGLGLSITKEAVELHGGTITVETQLDNGTTFTVTLPAR